MTIGKTQFPNGGANDRALPNRSYQFPGHTGDVLFVHSSGAGTAGPGWAVENAYTTIDSAIGACTADHGDTIVVCEGHTETISGAAGIALDVAGVKIIGAGKGRRRPRITFATATAASFDITAARCVVENLVLINGIDAQTAMVNISAADVVIAECEFQLGNSSTQAAIGILTTSGADRLIVEKCEMHGTVDAGVANGIKLVGGDFIRIRDNIISGAFATTGNIQNATTATTNYMILRNVLLNQSADANNVVINMHASATGVSADNRIAIIDSTGPAPIVAAAGWVSHNYSASAVGVGASTLI